MVGQKNTDGGKVFQFMKLEESMVGEDSEPEEMCSELAGTHFTIGKINSDENSGVQKVQNWINRGIPRNFEWISQPSPAEMLHVSGIGLLKYMFECLEILIGIVKKRKKKDKEDFDDLHRCLVQIAQKQRERDFPQMSIHNGITNGTKMCGSERVGNCFILSVLFIQVQDKC